MLVLFTDVISFPEKVFIHLNLKLLLLEVDQATQSLSVANLQWQRDYTEKSIHTPLPSAFALQRNCCSRQTVFLTWHISACTLYCKSDTSYAISLVLTQ